MKTRKYQKIRKNKNTIRKNKSRKNKSRRIRGGGAEEEIARLKKKVEELTIKTNICQQMYYDVPSDDLIDHYFGLSVNIKNNNVTDLNYAQKDLDYVKEELASRGINVNEKGDLIRGKPFLPVPNKLNPNKYTFNNKDVLVSSDEEDSVVPVMPSQTRPQPSPVPSRFTVQPSPVPSRFTVTTAKP